MHFCLLLPCHNDEEGLVQALKTVDYPFENWLAVVIDDGSRQPLHAEKVCQAAGIAFPIHIIRLQQNKGITTALNTGLDWITQNTAAPYIARLDCRDLCHPQRFYQQVEYLNRHPQVGLLGTWCQFATADGGLTYNYTTPVAHKAIQKAMHQRNVFIHPTVMFRTGLLKAGMRYPFDWPHAEDYAFCWQLLQMAEGAVLPHFLVTCAITRGGISYQNRQAQLQSRKEVVKAFGRKGGIKLAGLIRINLLMLVPNSVLLRLKGLKNNI